jgi:hypothetical protein
MINDILGGEEMLIKLSSEQVANYWGFLKMGFKEALPPTVGCVPDRMSNMLTAFLTAKLECWVSVEKGESNNITGYIATEILKDEISGTRSLFIYAVYGLHNSKASTWLEGVETLKKYAQANKCHRIIAYSDVPSIISFIEKAGGAVNYRLLDIPILKD